MVERGKTAATPDAAPLSAIIRIEAFANYREGSDRKRFLTADERRFSADMREGYARRITRNDFFRLLAERDIAYLCAKTSTDRVRRARAAS